jgi:hypothetical protein
VIEDVYFPVTFLQVWKLLSCEPRLVKVTQGQMISLGKYNLRHPGCLPLTGLAVAGRDKQSGPPLRPPQNPSAAADMNHTGHTTCHRGWDHSSCE